MNPEKTKDSSEIFADFTISRIEHSVRINMTAQQLNAIRAALVANDRFSQHSFDLRGSVSLFFARYYFVILGGRDRRRKTRLEELRRVHKGNIPIGVWLSFVTISLLVTILWLFIFGALYLLKRELGIDLFSNIHLPDLLSYKNSS